MADFLYTFGREKIQQRTNTSGAIPDGVLYFISPDDGLKYYITTTIGSIKYYITI